MLYVATSLLCFYSLAKGPQPGQYLGFSDKGEAEWLWLQHGARAIHRSHADALSRGWLDKEQEREGSKDLEAQQQTESTPDSVRLRNFDQQITKLRHFVSTLLAEDSTFSKYAIAIDMLQSCYSELHRTHGHAPARTRDINAWFYTREPDILASPQDKHPVALAIFAYLAVLIHQTRHVWYMQGWGSHIMSGIY